MLQNRWSVSSIDSGLALFGRDSSIRRKIFIMLAILEASPDYCDYFLPRKRSPLYLFIVIWAGIRASIKAAIGSVMLKLLIFYKETLNTSVA